MAACGILDRGGGLTYFNDFHIPSWFSHCLTEIFFINCDYFVNNCGFRNQ